MSKLGFFNNQKGNMTIVSVWLMMFSVVLAVVILNFANLYITNQTANTASEQASLAATSVVYDEVYNVIRTYKRDEFTPSLQVQYNLERQNLLSSNPNLSVTEAEKQAIDNVLNNNIPGDFVLRFQVRQAVNSASSRIPNVVRNVILENNAELAGAEVRFFNEDNRIVVYSTSTYEVAELEGMIGSYSNSLTREGIGLEVPFISLIFWSNQTIPIN